MIQLLWKLPRFLSLTRLARGHSFVYILKLPFLMRLAIQAVTAPTDLTGPILIELISWVSSVSITIMMLMIGWLWGQRFALPQPRTILMLEEKLHLLIVMLGLLLIALQPIQVWLELSQVIQMPVQHAVILVSRVGSGFLVRKRITDNSRRSLLIGVMILLLIEILWYPCLPSLLAWSSRFELLCLIIGVGYGFADSTSFSTRLPFCLLLWAAIVVLVLYACASRSGLDQ